MFLLNFLTLLTVWFTPQTLYFSFFVDSNYNNQYDSGEQYRSNTTYEITQNDSCSIQIECASSVYQMTTDINGVLSILITQTTTIEFKLQNGSYFTTTVDGASQAYNISDTFYVYVPLILNKVSSGECPPCSN